MPNDDDSLNLKRGGGGFWNKRVCINTHITRAQSGVLSYFFLYIQNITPKFLPFSLSFLFEELGAYSKHLAPGSPY